VQKLVQQQTALLPWEMGSQMPGLPQGAPRAPAFKPGWFLPLRGL